MSYYITTPIYYINDKPHIGHAYTTIIADIFARYHSLKDEDVFFLTGTDENSQKNVEAAEKFGMADRLEEYLDRQSAVFERAWNDLGITHSGYIRTTDERHHKSVAAFIRKVMERGDIYKGTYTGYYCVGCEEFVRKTDVVDGFCLIHKTKLKEISEKNYFFAISKYRQSLLDYIASHPDFIQPESKKNEVLRFIEQDMEDFSISRHKGACGIPFPGDESHVVYVWFDALINYVSGIGYGWDEELFKKYWPAQMHLVGKEILKFHCAYWPAMLMAADLPLPEKVFAHGWLTINGEKMSKSLGNAIDPIELAKQFGIETLRYYLAREIPFGSDGDFSFSRVEERYTADLANGLGNFACRVTTMASKEYHAFDTVVCDRDAIEMIEQTWTYWMASMEQYCPQDALSALWQLIGFGDKYIEQNRPWDLSKNDSRRYNEVIGTLLEILRHISKMITPFMPQTAEAIERHLGIGDEQRALSIDQSRIIGACAISRIEKIPPLFPPLVPSPPSH